MGHHGNRKWSFYFNGWVHAGHSADTIHIWEIKQEGRSHNGNPYSTVYADGVELANNQNSNNWHHPGKLSFGVGITRRNIKLSGRGILIFRGLMADNDRFTIEGYLGHKWGIMPSSHPWATEKPTFGNAVYLAQAVGVTTQSQTPIVRNREPANLTTNSAMLTGQLVDAGLGMIPSDPVNATFTPRDYPSLRLWLDVSDADGDGAKGSSYDDANVTLRSHGTEGTLPCPLVGCQSFDEWRFYLARQRTEWQSCNRHGSPTVIPNGQNNLSLIRYSGANGEYTILLPT